MVRSMFNLTTLPLSFWDYALESAVRILNMVPNKKVDKNHMKYGMAKRSVSVEDDVIGDLGGTSIIKLPCLYPDKIGGNPRYRLCYRVCDCGAWQCDKVDTKSHLGLVFVGHIERSSRLAKLEADNDCDVCNHADTWLLQMQLWSAV
ncbi:hypothetical protein Tco_0910205 [Tanacetum coccineum]|uniref:Retrotransposon protein, putative, Ty1-copia subclass n=1 Tax=Tanacetum coccineum TaxID=301880 RepID=A0ABQ5CSC4_9ASTR